MITNPLEMTALFSSPFYVYTKIDTRRSTFQKKKKKKKETVLSLWGIPLIMATDNAKVTRLITSQEHWTVQVNSRNVETPTTKSRCIKQKQCAYFVFYCHNLM